MLSRKASFVSCALLALAQGVFLLSRPPEETLLRRATPIRSLERGPNSAYFWLSNDELLLLWPDSGGGVVRYHPSRRALAAADGLGKTLADCDLTSERARSLQLSPDGKRLLWPGTERDRVWFAAEVANGERREWDGSESIGYGAQALWMPDGRHWAELIDSCNETRLRVHAVGEPGGFEIRHGFFAGGYRHLGFLDATRAIGIAREVSEGTVQAVEYEVRPNPPPRRLFSLKVPSDAYGAVEATLSPRGDRLAWRFEHKPAPFGLRFLNGATLVHAFPASRVALWVSRPDGSGMRRIGVVAPGSDALQALRWTPDGKRVSFLHGNRLWSVPVD